MDLRPFYRMVRRKKGRMKGTKVAGGGGGGGGR
jgi:hypothetical protein